MDGFAHDRPGARSVGVPWRPLAIFAAAAATLLAGLGLARLRIDDDLRALLRTAEMAGGRDTEADFRLIDEVSRRFGAVDRDVIVVVAVDSGDIFSGKRLSDLRRLTERLADLPDVSQVRSLLDVRREGVAGALLPVIPRSGQPLSPEVVAQTRERALRHPLINEHLLNHDATSTLVIVSLAPGADLPPRLATTVAALEQALAQEREAAGSGLSLAVTGLPALRLEASRGLRRDMILFNGLGLTLAMLLSASVARSLRATLVACLPPFMGAVWAMGVLGLCGVPVNILTSVVPSLALVVGTCDSIHFIEDMRRSIRRGIDPLAASGGALRRVGTACGVTSLVTAVGFLSLAAARIEAVRTFGLAAAAGAIASFAAVSLLTPLLASSPFCRGMQLGRSSRMASRVANLLAAWSIHHARPIVAVGLVATLFLGGLGLGLDADNRIVDALPSHAEAARTLQRVDHAFGGVMGVDVVVRWPEDVDWRASDVSGNLAAVHGVLERSGVTTRPLSLASVVSSLPDRARHRLSAESVRDLVDVETRTAVVRARVGDLGSRHLERVYDQIDVDLAEIERGHPGWAFRLAGMSVVSARNIRQLVRDLGSSLLLEVAVIGTILAVSFRSPLAGIVSLVPNIFPLAAVAAALVLTGRSLDPATVIVFNVCLGLAVDDTVHVLSALARNRRSGLSIATSIQRAICETGNAVVLGGVVLGVGFAAVTISSVPSLAGFGRLACTAVAAATVAELVLLPAILVMTDEAVTRFGDALPARDRDGIFGPASGPVAGVTGITATPG
jgi:predicted RND superfamily exporter protein